MTFHRHEEQTKALQWQRDQAECDPSHRSAETKRVRGGIFGQCDVFWVLNPKMISLHREVIILQNMKSLH